MNKTFDELKASGNLPTPAPIGMRILQLTQDENFSPDEIAKAIQADPALTGRILRVANSAQNAAVEGCVTVGEATMRLGITSVRNIALGFSLVSGNRRGSCAGFDYDEYWSSSLARAVAAHCIASSTGKVAPPEAFVCSLLSQVGRLAFAAAHPEEYSQILAATRGQSAAVVSQAEQEAFEIDHREVAAALMEEWGLPVSYSEATLDHYEFVLRQSPEETPSERLAAVLAAAEQLAEACLADAEGEHVQWTRHWRDLQAVRGWLGMGDEAFVQLCREIISMWRDWTEMLQMNERDAMTVHDIEQRASIHTSSVSEGDPAVAAQDAPDKLTILVADGDVAELREITESLRSLGHEALVARGGKQALRLVMENQPQVVVASSELPDLDGLKLCKSLRSFDAGARAYFIALSSSAEESQFVAAFDAGADDCIQKPVNLTLLKARIKGAQRMLDLQARVERDKEAMRKHAMQQSVLTRRLRAASLTDVLTGLPNRRYAMKRLAQEWDNTARTGGGLAVIMLDIDRFKNVNDSHGHDAGDEVLRQTAVMLRENTRKGEDACRLGGEEFLVILRSTSAGQAALAAERIRSAIEKHVIQFGTFHGSITSSFGVAQRETWMDSVDALLKAADEMVYTAKTTGRNRVCVRKPEVAPERLEQAG